MALLCFMREQNVQRSTLKIQLSLAVSRPPLSDDSAGWLPARSSPLARLDSPAAESAKLADFQSLLRVSV